METPPDIKHKLMLHQQQGLYWMAKRELEHDEPVSQLGYVPARMRLCAFACLHGTVLMSQLCVVWRYALR